MKYFHWDLHERLDEIRQEGLYRQLDPPRGVDFCSNDYLGLSQDPKFLKAILDRLESAGPSPFSPTSSRLLRGNTSEHLRIEKRLAQFKGAEAALIFPTGYQANIGLLTALLSPEDRVLSDAHNHASIIDGLRLSRCRKIIFPHLNTQAVEEALQKPHSGRTFLVTESLFSMDGDMAPLTHYGKLLQSHGAYLIVDDAHATGLYGEERGSGLTEHCGMEKQAVATISTFGKALGLFGAFVAGSRSLIEFLINECRPFIFTTATPPVLLLGIEAALDSVHNQPERRQQVCRLADRLRLQLSQGELDTLGSCGPIVPVLIGDNNRTVEVALRLQSGGFDVRAIRPPTVPPNTARLRISVHADHTEDEIDQLATATVEVTRQLFDK